MDKLIPSPDRPLVERFIEQLSDGLNPQAISEEAVWKPQVGPQTMAYFSEADELFFGGAAGGGKALSLDETILTENGETYLGDLQVGDAVCTPNGQFECVTAIYPQPIQPLYEITLQNKRRLRATAQHLWVFALGQQFHCGTTRQLFQYPEACLPVCSADTGKTINFVPIASIHARPSAETACIQISATHGLYIAGDDIVTHNTDFLLGWAITRARRSIIYRREYPQLKSIIARSRELLANTNASYNNQEHLWRDIPGGRTLEFGSVPHEESVTKYQGRPFDFIALDEGSNFLESQFLFLIGWNRSDVLGVRKRIVVAGNPPTTVEGEWVIRRWGPWINPQHPNPASPGEIRWFARIEDEDQEVEDNKAFKYKKELIRPTSRTFIPARVADNKYYGEDYVARLQSMPEPLRSKMLYGDFGIVVKDDPWQVISTTFVKEARNRYDRLLASGELAKDEDANAAYGADPAEGGKDYTALCKITGNVVRWIKYYKDDDTMKTTHWIISNVRRNALIGIDAIGIGAGIFHRMRELNYRAVGVKVSARTEMRDRTGQMQFLNLRAALWWLTRDLLDPTGSTQLALPPDDRLTRELTAPRWSLTQTGLVQIESQESLRERLGRSPDAANALMIGLFVSHVRRPELRIV